MEDIFFELYKSCYLKTKVSKRSRKKMKRLLKEVSEVLGEKKAEELQWATNIVCQEEGLRSFMEGFRFGGNSGRECQWSVLCQ